MIKEQTEGQKKKVIEPDAGLFITEKPCIYAIKIVHL